MPEKIPVSVLTEGIKDLKPLEDWGTYLAKKETKDKVSTSQIRKLFGSIKRIQADFDKSKGEILLLEPKLAYAVGRDADKYGNTKTKIDELYKMLSPLIREVREDKARFHNFVNVFESIVAYHKAAGGE